MADKTGIAWTDATWNPVTGCSKVSPGCDHCYALRMSHRLQQTASYRGLTHQVAGADGKLVVDWAGEVRCLPERLTKPLTWKAPSTVFVCSMSDLFHPAVPWDFLVRVFDVMASTNWHTYQVLTKRPGRMAYFAEKVWPKQWERRERLPSETDESYYSPLPWPSNVWAGTSLEQMEIPGERGVKCLTGRLDCLARVPAKVRFVSVEPMLGPVDLRPWMGCGDCKGNLDRDIVCACGNVADWEEDPRDINWVIAGGESGPGHRPMELAWLEDLAGQCDHAGVPLFVKQDSGPRPGQQGRIPDLLWARKEMP